MEEALLAKTIDVAVHSNKDLPTENPEGLIIAGVSSRENPADWLIIREDCVDDQQKFSLKKGAKVGTSSATPRISLIEELASDNPLIETNDSVQTYYKNFNAEVFINNVTIKYQQTKITALKNVNLTIEEGSFVAIVGPTGSGKTTLVDTILGIIQPSEGSVEISGKTPTDAIRTWPGSMSYVPQQIHISKGSVLENIALGYPINSNVSLLALESSKLAELNLDLEHEIG